MSIEEIVSSSISASIAAMLFKLIITSWLISSRLVYRGDFSVLRNAGNPPIYSTENHLVWYRTNFSAFNFAYRKDERGE
jgi:hypothetical protein